MAHGKMKTLHGLYKKVGRDAFLKAAKFYSRHVKDSIDATLAEMESRWYDSAHTITEAEKMIEDYNNGVCVLCQDDTFFGADRQEYVNTEDEYETDNHSIQL
ncbi:MAG TPA: hypothetical protein PLT66_01700 [Bacillota bacterium]|nr:hypothetical protein [Bacillota bacterium]